MRGAKALGQRLAELTGAGAGEPAADGQTRWEWFACLGQCDHAPALLVGEEAERDVTPERLESIITEAHTWPRRHLTCCSRAAAS